jgi:DNA-binding LacI/PurR family transcriptional regulator
MIRLRDIAARAGVSVMTVSKALRDQPDVAASTKARVRQLAQEMGYVPDSAAQSLRTRRTRLLGLVLPAPTNPIFARVVMAIEDRAYALGYDLLLGHSLNLVEREESCIRRFLSRRVDGLFVFPVYRLAPTVPIYEELALRGTPTVVLGLPAPFCSHFVSIGTDDLPASLALAQHLLQLGHRRIAFFAGPSAAPWAQERLEGYRRALITARVEFDDQLVFSAGSTIEEGERAAQVMLQEKVKVTAIQAVNDLVAVGAANVLLNQGIRIPDDISVVGFGNILTSAYFRVPLTTVRQPKLRLGHAAMDAMQQLLRGESPPSQRLDAQLVLRLSTGPPPGLTIGNAPPQTDKT